MSLPSRPAAPAPVPGRPVVQQSTYQQIGALQAEHLLDGERDQFAHLEEKILAALDYAQKVVTEAGRAEEASDAPHDPKVKAVMAEYLDRVLMNFMAQGEFARKEEKPFIVSAVINEIIGLGAIEPLWMDPRITEVMVNGPNNIFVEIGGKVRPARGAQFRSQQDLLDLCQRILAPLNRRVDQNKPMTDGRLPDGSRVNIVHTSIAPAGPLLTIRRFPDKHWTLADLVENGSLDEDMAVELAFLVYHRASTLVVGGTGSGKTTLLNAMSSCIPKGERIVTIEDSLELRLHPAAHAVAMEGRPAATNGQNEVRIRDLVKNSLRMRPDRIIVGEVRDSTALDMLQAMNTGHEGSMTTIHANGPEEAVNRLGVLVAQGGEIPADKVSWLIGDAVDIMVMQSRFEDGSRRVSGIYEVPTMKDMNGQDLTPIPLWEWEQTGTDDDGRFVGRYVKKGEISERLTRLRRLNQFQRLTIEDVRRFAREGA